MPEENTTAALIAPENPISFNLQDAADLGAKAKGAEIVTLQRGPLMTGLPEAVPALLVRGEKPSLEDVSPILEKYRLFPARKSGTAKAQTLDAFIDLSNRHKTEHSAIFADLDWQKPSLTTIVDYHEISNGGLADNCKHRVRYDFPLSDEWKIWIENDGKVMSQQDFAYFLEDRIPDLSSPTEAEIVASDRDFSTTVATPSQLVQLSRKMQVNVSSVIKNATTLQTGEGQIQWEESHTDADGQPVKVPGIFILSIPPFFMGDKVRIPVRLRYRAAGGKMNWFYNIYRPDQVITQHVEVALNVARSQTELLAYAALPEISA